MAGFGPRDVRVREPSWGRASASAVVMLVGLVMVVALAVAPPEWGASAILVGFAVVLVGLVGFVKSALSPPHGKARAVSLAVSDRQLLIDGRPIREPVTATKLEPGAELSIFCGTGRPRMIATLESREDAIALAGALTPAVSRLPSFRLSGTSTFVGRVAFVLGVVAISLGNALALGFGQPAWMLLLLLGFALLLSPSTARVGSDGVVISRLGVETFLPFSDPATLAKLRKLNHAALMERVELERAEVSDAGAAVSFEQLLARGERTTSAWKAHLREVARASYRGAAIENDRLWQIVRRSSGDDSTRLGAALILRARGEDVRVAAETTASPELRIALTEIAADDDPFGETRERDTMKR